MPCKLRDEIATRYVIAVQDAASDQLIQQLVRELRDHEISCGCGVHAEKWERLVRPEALTAK